MCLGLVSYVDDIECDYSSLFLSFGCAVFSGEFGTVNGGFCSFRYWKVL